MQIKLIVEVVMNDSRPASNSARATHYFVRTFIVDYLVKWGNFNILNIKLQGLGNKLKKKNFGDQDVSFVLFLYAKEPSTTFYVSKLVYWICWWDALRRTENTVFLSPPVPYRTNYGRYQFPF